MMDNYQRYFNNVLAQTYVLDNKKIDQYMTLSDVQEVIIIKNEKNKEYVLGKAKDNYFIITYNSRLEYSMIALHENLETLLTNFNNYKILTEGYSASDFVNVILFKNELEKDLPQAKATKKYTKI